MNKNHFTNNVRIYQKQISGVISKVSVKASPALADAIYKSLIGYAKGTSIWYGGRTATFSINGPEELQGCADALGVHCDLLANFLEKHGGLTTDVCYWSLYEEGVRLVNTNVDIDCVLIPEINNR